jgi:dihydrofolate reductase
MITLIAAAGENNELGKDNDLVWHLPEDFKRFKKLTSGHHIIMGRKTFESFPKLLPHRTHIVITRNKSYRKEGIIVVASMEEALEVAKNDDQPFIIGGGEIYHLGLSVAQKIELTRVHGTFEADSFFPQIAIDEWILISEEFYNLDEKHAYAFTYQTYIRREFLEGLNMDRSLIM